ncbi:MAG: HAD family hydrolase [Actinomycetota bacterium]
MILPSWRDGATRDTIIEFLRESQKIAPEQRIAAFDNDGTMWCEKPNYTQFYFLIDALKSAVEANPALVERPEYRAILDRDREAMGQLGLERVGMALVDLFTGDTPEGFEVAVRSFFERVEHPDRGVPFKNMRYQPMLELLDAVRDHGFTVYVVTGGGAEFVRVVGRDFYDVTPAQVVGSQIAYETRVENDVPVLIRTGEMFDSPNEGASKVPHLQRQIGQRPMLAVGNSPGDAEMLEYAAAFDGPSLAMIVNHDDAEREYAYESVAGTFETEETITEKANRLGWTTISMRNDWETVFRV